MNPRSSFGKVKRKPALTRLDLLIVGSGLSAAPSYRLADLHELMTDREDTVIS